MAATTVAAAVSPTPATPAHAAPFPEPLPLLPLRIPQLDLGIEQQSDEKIQWLRDAKLGMFIHWGVYAGPAKGEWYMENAAIPPENYRKYVTDATGEQFTASAYNPADWAQLAKDMGARYTVLTARHHDGFALWPSRHPNAWHSGQAPLQRDFIGQYVTAVRDAGLRVGLYYSPLSWRYPGYYDVRGTNCLPNKWGYVTDAAHKENARIMKNEVYQQVKELVTQYGKIDDLWWDGGWLGQQGTDADAAFFWEPGKFRDPPTSGPWTPPSARPTPPPAGRSA
ncbi:alpha-L-fucosidase [Streptomyces sp. NPDC051243]|uniref:alpha-L-fucosidase n=1 Tax=Streptomyces sp. NPDC051243 TaxID=3365646 RepID=UPI0037B0AEC9